MYPPSDEDPRSQARCVTTPSSREAQHAVGRDNDAGATFRIFDGTFLIRREDINIFLEVVAAKLPRKNGGLNGKTMGNMGGTSSISGDDWGNFRAYPEGIPNQLWATPWNKSLSSNPNSSETERFPMSWRFGRYQSPWNFDTCSGTQRPWWKLDHYWIYIQPFSQQLDPANCMVNAPQSGSKDRSKMDMYHHVVSNMRSGISAFFFFTGNPRSMCFNESKQPEISFLVPGKPT